MPRVESTFPLGGHALAWSSLEGVHIGDLVRQSSIRNCFLHNCPRRLSDPSEGASWRPKAANLPTFALQDSRPDHVLCCLDSFGSQAGDPGACMQNANPFESHLRRKFVSTYSDLHELPADAHVCDACPHLLSAAHKGLGKPFQWNSRCSSCSSCSNCSSCSSCSSCTSCSSCLTSTPTADSHNLAFPRRARRSSAEDASADLPVATRYKNPIKSIQVALYDFPCVAPGSSTFHRFEAQTLPVKVRNAEPAKPQTKAPSSTT